MRASSASSARTPLRPAPEPLRRTRAVTAVAEAKPPPQVRALQKPPKPRRRSPARELRDPGPASSTGSSPATLTTYYATDIYNKLRTPWRPPHSFYPREPRLLFDLPDSRTAPADRTDLRVGDLRSRRDTACGRDIRLYRHLPRSPSYPLQVRCAACTTAIGQVGSCLGEPARNARRAAPRRAPRIRSGTSPSSSCATPSTSTPT